MPDRHSTPVQPRCTTFCTSVSQSTPAPARTSGLGPSRNSIPPMVRRRMSPGNPESRKTTLLPPPRTYAGRRRSAAYASAARRLPAYVLGGGSNVVFLDSGFPGLILRLTIGGIELRDGPSPEVRAGAGVDWDTLVQNVVPRGWTGVECV